MADALSRKVEPDDDLNTAGPSTKVGFDYLTLRTDLDSQEGVLCMISFPSPTWLSDLKASYATDQQVQGIMQALGAGQVAPHGYSLQNGLLLYKGKIYLGTCDALKKAVLHQVHDSPLGGDRKSVV